MAFYQIGKFRAFYDKEKFSEIDEKYLSQFSAIDRSGIFISTGDKPSKEQIELQEHRMDILSGQLEFTNEKIFYEAYCKLNYDGIISQRYVIDLLWDFCFITKMGKILDVRSSIEKIEDDYLGKPDTKAVILRYYQIPNTIWSYMFGKKSKIDIVIKIDRVKKIEGDLTLGFWLHTKDFTLNCDIHNKNIRILSKGEYN